MAKLCYSVQESLASSHDLRHGVGNCHLGTDSRIEEDWLKMNE